MQWCNRSRVWREAAPAAEHRAQGQSLNQPSCGPQDTQKRLDHMPWFSFTPATNPGMQDALRALQSTNQSRANTDNSEICLRSALLIQTKLLPGKARELPNYRAQLSDLLARWTPSAACFQGVLFPTVLSHLESGGCFYQPLLQTGPRREKRSNNCCVRWCGACRLSLLLLPHKSRRAPARSLSLEIHP